MSERDSAALALDEADGSALEQKNRELASKQVRQINDTLRKVRRISRESQQMARLSPEDLEADTNILQESRPTDPAPPLVPVVVQEVMAFHRRDSRRERDDSTDKFLIPEPSSESPVSEVFQKAFEMFASECERFQFTRGKNSPVIRSWKLV